MLAWASLPPTCHQSVYHVLFWICTTRTLHMPKPAKPSLSQNEVKVLKLKPCQSYAWPYHGHVLWLDTADLSDHGPIIALQALQVRLDQWPSFTGMEHGAPYILWIFVLNNLQFGAVKLSSWGWFHQKSRFRKVGWFLWVALPIQGCFDLGTSLCVVKKMIRVSIPHGVSHVGNLSLRTTSA